MLGSTLNARNLTITEAKVSSAMEDTSDSSRTWKLNCPSKPGVHKQVYTLWTYKTQGPYKGGYIQKPQEHT